MSEVNEIEVSERSFLFLKRVFGILTVFSPEEKAVLKGKFSLRKIQRGEYFQRAGETPEFMALVYKGLFRIFYLREDGKEYITNFCRPGHFVANYSSLLTGRPTSQNSQALEDCLVFVLPFDVLRNLYRTSPGWMQFGKSVAENLFVEKEERERELLILSAEERYLKFRRRYRKMEQSIPHYHIASYLGVTNVALSRIRSRLKDAGLLL